MTEHSRGIRRGHGIEIFTQSLQNGRSIRARACLTDANMDIKTIKVLVIEDNPDDFFFLRTVLDKVAVNNALGHFLPAP